MTKFGEWQYPITGIRRKIFPPGQNMMSMMIELEKEAVGPAHSHPHEQLTFVISGKLEVTLEEQVHIVAAGEQLHIPGDVVHTVKALEDSAILETFTPLREDLLATITDSQ